MHALLANGAEINQRGICRGQTALCVAAENGHEEIVQALLTNGANVEDRNMFGWTVLTIAIVHRHQEVVRILLANGARE